MPITTLQGIKDNLVLPSQINKSGAASGVTSANTVRMTSSWYAAGSPAPATANVAGVNGQALTAPVTGMVPRVHPSSGDAYLSKLSLKSTPSMMWIIDRLWENSGLSVTATTAQAITPATLPARDINGTSNGEGVFAGIEWSTVAGAGSPTVTLTYTNQDGVTGRTATFVGGGLAPVGCIEIFNLDAGDTGVRAPTSFIQSATRTSGVMHLVLFRVIACWCSSSAFKSTFSDAVSLCFPKIPSGAVLMPCAVAPNLSYVMNGSIQEAIG